ncbi:wax ester/triacylglycerol synthase domain-containing protein [Hoyosella subflava]|uniref:diacylglycerol O-acyltransferase n=1 Tax=Hoyosella subflava (strain DSM 45089 / JCM 17490 / NBRC 109087 / DQS3-9A1) TaxID=443218 RepID=F6EK10_HOYSD|nr:wax ester/triacylglycerol synthase domain-containing protein [Hoyosella subflava]AEF41368.1 hypothetical protein AS9A_2921 [Hoyosella subflava DQS3-9A1]
MEHVERLNPQEWLFLQMTPKGVRWYSIVCGFAASPTDGPHPELEDLRRLAASRIHFAPPRFRQKVVPTPLGVAPPAWVDDADFTIADHVRDAGLPESATRQDFLDFCAYLASAPIDMTHSPWDCHLAPQLADGTTGFVIRGHHCMLDGANMLSFVAMFGDVAAEPTTPGPPEPWQPRPEPSRWQLLRSGVDHTTRRALNPDEKRKHHFRETAAWKQAWDSVKLTATAARDEVAPFGSRTVFNRQPGAERALETVRTSMSTLKSIAHTYGAKLNDVAVAVIAEALDRFYAKVGRRPPKHLKLLIPISYEPRGDETGTAPAGEHVAFMNVVLPLGTMEFSERVRKVAAQTSDHVERGIPEHLDHLMVTLGRDSDLLYRLAQRVVQSPASANLTLSNVRGPNFPIYLRGARVTELYPVIPLGPHHSLAVGVLSLEDRLFFATIRSPQPDHALAPFDECLREAVGVVEAAERSLMPDV